MDETQMDPETDPQQPAAPPPQADQWASTTDHAPDPTPQQSGGDWASTTEHSPASRSWADKLGIPSTGGDGRVNLARNAVDFAEGAASGLNSTIFHMGDIPRRIFGMDRPVTRPEIQQQMSAPPSMAGTLGKGAEQLAEFAVPLSKASAATKGASLIRRALTEGATSGVVAAAQTGGDPGATAMGAITGAAGPVIGAGLRSGAQAAVDRFTSMAPRPLSPEALSIAAKYDVPLTQGTMGGSKTVQAVEKMLGHTVAPDLYEALMQKGQQGVTAAASGAAGGFGVDRFAAGDNTMKKLLDVADQHSQEARTHYGALDAAERDPANVKTIVTGMNPSTILDAQGNPIMMPETKQIALPVYMTGAKAQLKPIRDLLVQQLPVAQQQYSAGLHAIQNILDGEDVVSASTAEGNLSAIKQILREAVSDKVKRLAGLALDAINPSVDQAVANAGPDATKALAGARAAWKNRSQVLDLVDQLSGDVSGKSGQTNAARRLMAPADASYPLLQKVLAVAPDAAQDLGKAYLGRVFKKASTGELTNPTQAANLWNQIGSRTKAAIYSSSQIQDINATLELAKRIGENPNPSGTGIINSLLKMGVLVTHPVAGGSGFVFGRNAAKVLYDPAGANSLKLMLQGNANQKALTVVKSLIASGAEDAGGNQ